MPYLTFDKLTLLVAVIACFIFTRRTDRPALRVFPFLLLLELTVSLLGRYYSLHRVNNLLLYNLFAMVQFSFFTWFFIQTDPLEKTVRWMQVLLFIIPIVMAANTFLVQGLFVFNTYTFTSGSLLMIFLGCRFLFRMFKSPVNNNPLRNPAFWITVGVIFYFVSTVTILSLANTISRLPRSTRGLLQTILFTVNVLYYILFIIAFTCRIKHPKS